MADDSNETYPLVIGLTFLFNLLLGTGVLTMPLVFKEAGYVTGVIVITLLCFISYIQVTFLVEAMANANFIKKVSPVGNANTSTNSESVRLLESDDEDEEEIEKEFSSTCNHPPQLLINDNGINAIVETFAISAKQSTAATATAFSRTSTATDLSPLLLGTTSTSLSEKEPGSNFQDENDKKNYDSTDDSHLGHVNASFEGDETIKYEKKLQGQYNEPEPVDYGTSNNQQFSVEEETFSRLSKHSSVFNIAEKFELGDMTNMFLSKILSQFFFLSIIIYLFGDLMIYNTMMSKSLREISCTSKVFCNATAKGENPLDAVCWDKLPGFSRRNVYRIYLIAFVALLLPLIYAGLKKTQSIQVITIILRWLAFFSMVGISLKIFIKGEATGAPEVMNLRSVPKMFGICIYAFMCHHSVPSILTPVKQKRHLLGGLTIDYILVAGCYLLIALTGIFAFGKIEDVYTLNFQINDCPSAKNNTDGDRHPGNVLGFDIFLPTYPIFTLFSSYTMIALTLINNMKVLARNWTDVGSRWVTITFPLIAMLPSMLVSLFTEDVAAIVSYVGSYAGGLIQYVFPCLLVFYSRKIVKQKHLLPFVARKLQISPTFEQAQLPAFPRAETEVIVQPESAFGQNVGKLYRTMNRFASPFQHTAWIVATAVWWVLSLVLVTLDHLLVSD